MYWELSDVVNAFVHQLLVLLRRLLATLVPPWLPVPP